MEALILLLHSIHPLSPAIREHLKLRIKKYTYKKRQTIVKEGEKASLILYLEKGLIRSYSVVDGQKASNYFMREGDIIISVESFFEQVPAYDSIEALEDCVCWGITFDELEETYLLHPDFNIHGRKITAIYYCKSEARHRSQHRKKPEEKYQILMEKDPELLSRVKDSHVASYLDVSKATYSGIKRRYAEILRHYRR
jgi:CRP-like cAMP-binding protein